MVQTFTRVPVGEFNITIFHLIREIPPLSRWVPVFVDTDQKLGVMSISFLLAHEDDAVVWRGPKKNGMPW